MRDRKLSVKFSNFQPGCTGAKLDLAFHAETRPDHSLTWVVRMRWRWAGRRSGGWGTPRRWRIVVVVAVWRMGRLRVLAKAVPRVSCERIPGILKYKTNNVLCKNFPCQFMLIFMAQFVWLFFLSKKKLATFTMISFSPRTDCYLSPVSQVKGLERCSQHSSLSSLTGPPLEIEWVPGRYLHAQNDTRMEGDFCRNVSWECKLRWTTVQYPTGQQYPSRLFCLCTARRQFLVLTDGQINKKNSPRYG